jgi:hypothetical protein
MSAASSASQAAPDTIATASALQIMTLQRCRSVVRPTLFARPKAGSATSGMKQTVPAMSAVAARWTARARMIGSITLASVIRLSLGDHQGTTRNVKLPLARWVSTDRMRQITL